MDKITILLIAIIFLLTGLVASVCFYWFSFARKIDRLLEKGKVKDFKDIFLSQKEKSAELENQLKEAFLRIKDLEDISKRTIKKVAIIRFNPFNELGGNQSFVIALLDNNHNGFVISSLFTQEGIRVYAKSVVNETSDYTLSEEEKEAIDKAIKNHGKKN